MNFFIPSIICGDVEEGEDITLKYPGKDRETSLFFSKINEDDIQKIKSSSRDIHNLHLDEIISFYTEVQELWLNKDYPLRKDAINLASKVTGYHKNMVEHVYDLAISLLSKDYLEHLVDGEIRDKELLDKWVKIKDSYVHAQPRGRVLHILSGNAPPISVTSLIRGSLTKNANLMKLPSGDPVTSTYFVLSFKDVDENHPITKTTSVFYVEKDSLEYDNVISLSNAICVWGGTDALSSVRKKSSPETPLLEFGPKRSMQLVGREAIDHLEKTTKRIAYDLVLYDQEACHSPQFLFLESHPKEFCTSLAKSLEEETKKLPKGYVSLEKHAQISNERLLTEFYGEEVYTSSGTDWTIIVTNNIKRTLSHPLSRTLYVFKVNNLSDSLKYIDETVQSVAVYPDSRIKELRDEITLKGASRVTHIGKMGHFALGAPHEGIYPMANLVRFVKSR